MGVETGVIVGLARIQQGHEALDVQERWQRPRIDESIPSYLWGESKVELANMQERIVE